MNKPPAAASKIVTATVSPMPNNTGAGGRLSVKAPARTAGSYSISASATSLLSFTRAYGTDDGIPVRMSSEYGPDAGVGIHSEAQPAAKTQSKLHALKRNN